MIIPIHPYVLAGLWGSLSAIHLSLLDRFAHSNQFSSSLLLWVAIAGLSRQHWSRLQRSTSLSACGVGGTVLIGLIVHAVRIAHYDPILRLWPLLALLSLALLMSGWRGLHQHWRVAIAWAILSLPPGPVLRLIDPSLLTAKITNFLLWYLGWQVSRQGAEIALPGGSIAVLPGCSGVESILQLLGLAVLFVLFFSPGWFKSCVAIAGAIVLAVITNSIRVALMAVLYAQSGQPAFEYWHTGDGSHIFSLLAVTLFAVLGLLLIRQGQETTVEVSLN